MNKKNYLEVLIEEDRIDNLKELISHKESFTKLIAPQKNGKTVLEMALFHNKYEIVNLLGSTGVLEMTKFGAAEYVITNTNMNESTKLKYLQLFHAYGIDLNITFNVKDPKNQLLSHYYTILEYSIDLQYLHIFNWLIKSKVRKRLGDNTSLLSKSFRHPKNKIAKAIVDGKTPLRKGILVNELIGKEEEPLFSNFLWFYITHISGGIKDYDNDTLINKCDFLIEAGYDFNLRDKKGQTVLHVIANELLLLDTTNKGSITKELIELIKYLLNETLLDTNIKNYKGLNAIEMIEAIDFKDKFKKKLILLLFK